MQRQKPVYAHPAEHGTEGEHYVRVFDDDGNYLLEELTPREVGEKRKKEGAAALRSLSPPPDAAKKKKGKARA